jgi:hypothetical protein
MRFEILITVTVKNMAFWSMAVWVARRRYIPEDSIFHQIFMCVGYHVFSAAK